METFGQRLVFAREQQNISQKDLANKLGITPTRLNYWEKDKREPTIAMIKALAQILEVDTDFLIGLHKSMPKETEKSPSADESTPRDETEAEKSLLSTFRHLNEDGQRRVIEHADDLLASGRYLSEEKSRIAMELKDPQNQKDAAAELVPNISSPEEGVTGDTTGSVEKMTDEWIEQETADYHQELVDEKEHQEKSRSSQKSGDAGTKPA